MINFFRHMGWSFEQIENFLNEWNKKNGQPLRDGYVSTQVGWAKKNNQKILPPNCDNQGYYKGMGFCFPDELCRMIRNPVQYSTRRIKLAKMAEEEEAKKNKAKKSKKKESKADSVNKVPIVE